MCAYTTSDNHDAHSFRIITRDVVIGVFARRVWHALLAFVQVKKKNIEIVTDTFNTAKYYILWMFYNTFRGAWHFLVCMPVYFCRGRSLLSLKFNRLVYFVLVILLFITIRSTLPAFFRPKFRLEDSNTV